MENTTTERRDPLKVLRSYLPGLHPVTEALVLSAMADVHNQKIESGAYAAAGAGNNRLLELGKFMSRVAEGCTDQMNQGRELIGWLSSISELAAAHRMQLILIIKSIIDEVPEDLREKITRRICDDLLRINVEVFSQPTRPTQKVRPDFPSGGSMGSPGSSDGRPIVPSDPKG
jgi:hypothetical protein